jgi:hypothetical protein
MVQPKCPTCGAVIGKPSEYNCVKLQGTKYLDPTKVPQFGAIWCPDFAAELGALSLYSGYEVEVNEEIEKAKSRG